MSNKSTLYTKNSTNRQRTSEDCQDYFAQHILKTTWQVRSNPRYPNIHDWGEEEKKLTITNQTGNYSKVDGYQYPSKNPTGTSSNIA